MAFANLTGGIAGFVFDVGKGNIRVGRSSTLASLLRIFDGFMSYLLLYMFFLPTQLLSRSYSSLYAL